MDADEFLAVTGQLLIVGKSPDGDSVRFVPDHVETLESLQNGDRLRVAADGSVQLRLDAIDAPETHYANHHQPLAGAARDELVTHCGFSDVTYNAGGVVTTADPDRVPALIAAKLVETHGRPVAYLFPRPRAIDPPLMWADGDAVTLDAAALAFSTNEHMVTSGRAYTTLYTSTPPALREHFTDLARKARGTAGSVWAADRTARFELTDRASIEEQQLLLPKLFRRATDYLTAREKGLATSFRAWLTDADENDEVDVHGQRTTLADLITENGTTIELTADLLDLVFVEK